MHHRNLIAAIAVIAALFVVADGNLPTRNRFEPCGIVLLGAALPRRTLTQTARTAALEGTCEVAQFEQGFTLIELSIVLVIIGLIVGGVLVGADMIKAAATRAQISQIEKYNSAVSTFVTKYGYLPGDIPSTSASSFGFYTGSGCNGQYTGYRNGDGLIDGGGASVGFPLQQGIGEVALFWSDLSAAGFTDGAFTGTGITCGTSLVLSTTQLPGYFPTAKIGNGNFLYVYETGIYNWFGLSAVTSTNSGAALVSGADISVNQAYNMDKKIDDGLPTTGNVVAVYLNTVTARGGQQQPPSGNPDTASTCYNSSTNTYSTNISNGSNPNCALSFKMQGAAR